MAFGFRRIGNRVDSGGAAAAQEQGAPPRRSGRRPRAWLLASALALLLPAGLRASQPVEPDLDPTSSWLVRLEGPGAWDILAAERKEGRDGGAAAAAAAVAAVAEAQVRVERALVDLGGQVVDRYQLVFNGFLVHATEGQAHRFAELPGVAGVSRAPLLQPAVRKVAATLRADQAQAELGLDGSGVTVAVIDTGMDYEHAMLGGSGDPDDFLENDEDRVEPGSFPTVKVQGGYDFAGARYSAACLGSAGPDCPNRPQPDGDPLDPAGLGHGTHVAGIIAGRAALPRVPAGVAPGASLVALKIFGNPRTAPASSDLALSALEWALRHNLGLQVPGAAPSGRIDVVNLSLGTDWSARMVEVEDAVARVVEGGITVVASAGNAGPLAYVAGSPGTAGMALSVASSLPAGLYEPRVATTWRERDGRFTTEALEVLEAAPDWLPGFGELPPLAGDLVWLGDACQPLADRRLALGRIALIERGGCSFFDKLQAAALGGALAAVVFTDGAQKVTMACSAPAPCAAVSALPAGMIDRAPGIALRDRLLGGQVVKVALEARSQAQLSDTISDFSSRGPARFNAAIKPDLTAPGSGILSARAGGGTKLVELSGTSMAGPAVAGEAALVWQRNRREGLGLDAAEVAALILNHADAGIHVGRQDTGPLAPIMRQGAGRADALRASRGRTVVRSPIGLAALSFGHVHLGDAGAQIRQSLRVRNLAPFGQRYRPEAAFAYPLDDAQAGVRFVFDPPVLQIPPKSEGRLDVTLVLDAKAVRAWRLRGAEPVRDELRLGSQELDGYVVLQAVDGDDRPVSDGDRVSLPFHVLPRHHACLASAEAADLSFWEEGETVGHAVRNPCAREGSVEPYALIGRDATESALAEGFPPKLDLEAVGLRYGMALPDDPASIVLAFALKTRGARRIPVEADLRVLIDAGSDGAWDKVLYQRHAPAVDQRLPAGRWLTLVAPVLPGSLAPDERLAQILPAPLAYDLDESVTVLAAPADLLGIKLAPGRGRFDWAALAVDAVGDFPLVAGYPGYDLMPDDLTRGGRLSFDQRATECLAWTDQAGRRLDLLGQSLRLEPGAEVGSQLRLACPPSALPAEAGLFLHYPDNPPLEQAELRLVRPAVPATLPSPSPWPSPSASPAVLPPAALPPTASPAPSAAPEDPSATPAGSAPPTAGPSATPPPTVTAPVAPRLSLRQAAGAGKAGAPLLADWPAYLEVHGAVEEAQALGAWRLEGFAAGGMALPGSPLAPVPPPSSAGTEADLSAAASLGFLLPPSWTAAGSPQLRLRAADGASLAELRPVFETPPALAIDLVPIHLQPGGVGAVQGLDLAGDGARALGWLARALPLRLAPRLHPAWRFEGLTDKPKGRQALLHQLAQLRLAEHPAARLDGRADGAPVVLGLLPPGSGMAGLALQGGGVALAGADDPVGVARALALALGLPPVACDLAAAADAGLLDRGYPYAGGSIGGWGLDLASWRDQGAAARDLLSGCAPAWLSDHHLGRLVERLREVERLGAAAAAAGGAKAPGWLLTGQWQAAGRRLSLDPLRSLPALGATGTAVAGAALRVELLDEVGRSLWEAGLNPVAQLDGLARSGSASLALQVPRHPDAAVLRVSDDDGSLAQLPLGGAGARLDALLLDQAPGRGSGLIYARLARRGAPLSAPLDLYLGDERGQSLLLRAGLLGERLTVDLAGLPASRSAFLELRATVEGQALVSRLPLAALPAPAPAALILAAPSGDVAAGRPLVAMGAGLDAAGSVAPERLLWELPERQLRQEGPLFLLPEGLPDGHHRLRLTVLGAGGAQGASRETVLRVGGAGTGGEVYLPRVGRR